MSESHSSQHISTDVWSDVRGAVEAFENAWLEYECPDLAEFIPAGDAASLALIALVKSDMEQRADRGEDVRVETYLADHETLNGPSVLELIVAEYRLRADRREFGSHAEYVSEFEERFPELSDQLTNALKQASVELETITQVEPTDGEGGKRLQLKLPEISGYQLLGPLGKGGMGAVFKARDEKLRREVAIKLPRTQLAEHEEGRERFLREARAAAKLRHPNVCPIYEVGDQLETPYIVMAFIDGKTFGRLIQQKQLSARDSALALSKVARAVSAAHQQQIIHRDIKPENILVDAETGEPILTDFGLAKELSGDSDLTHTGQVMGTPAYMAPEQAAGDAAIGPLSDVYSLGAVLYFALCGQPPFRGTVPEILSALTSEEPVSPRRRQPALHRDLETICIKAIAKRPQDRYESASALADDLQRFCDGESILAKPDSFVRRSWRKAKRQPLTAALLAMLIILGIGAGAWMFRINQRASATAQLRNEVSAQLDMFPTTALDNAPSSVRKLASTIEQFASYSPQEAASRSRDVDKAIVRFVSTATTKETLRDVDIPKLTSLVDILREREANDSADQLDRQLSNVSRGWIRITDSDDSSKLFAPSIVEERTGGLHRIDRVFTSVAKDQERTVLLSTTSPKNVRFDVTFSPGWEESVELGVILGGVAGPRKQVAGMAISPDGRFLATSDARMQTRVWDLRNNRLHHNVSVEIAADYLAFSHDGNRLLLSSTSPKADRKTPADFIVWNVEDAQVVVQGTHVSRSSVSTDGSKFAAASADGIVQVKSMHDGSLIRELEYLGQHAVVALAFSDNDTLFVFDQSGRVSEWDPTKNVELRVLWEGSENVAPRFATTSFYKGVMYVREHRMLLANWEDGITRVWRTDTTDEPLTLAHPIAIEGMDVSLNGELVATTSGPYAYVWDITNGRQISKFSIDKYGAHQVKFMPDSRSLLAASKSNSRSLNSWDLSGKRLQEYTGRNQHSVRFMCHFPSSTVVLVDGLGVIRRVNVDSARIEKHLNAFDYEFRIFPNQDRRGFDAQLDRAGATVNSTNVQRQPKQSDGKLRLRIQRVEGRVQGWVGEINEGEKPTLSFDEIFAEDPDPQRQLGLLWPRNVDIESIDAYSRRESNVRDLWQFANKYYSEGRFDVAQEQFRDKKNALAANPDPDAQELWQEAVYKEASCLLRMGKTDEAIKMFGDLSQHDGRRWPVYSLTQLMVDDILNSRTEDANEKLGRLRESGWDFRQLAPVIPVTVRDQLMIAGRGQFQSFGNWFGYDPNRIENLRRLSQIEQLTLGKPDPDTTLALLRALRIEGRVDETLAMVNGLMMQEDMASDLAEDIAWILRRHGKVHEAISFLDRHIEFTSDMPERGVALCIERVRAEIAKGDNENALRLLDQYLDPTKENLVFVKRQLLLIRGFLLSDLERESEAVADWQRGFDLFFESETGEPELGNHSEWTFFMLLGSLSGKLDAELLDKYLPEALSQFTEGTALGSMVQTTLFGDAFLKKAKWLSNALRGSAAPQSSSRNLRLRIAEQMIEAFKTPRGRKLAKQVAFLDIDFPDLVRDPALIMACQIMGHQANPNGLSSEQEQAIWDLSHDLYRRMLIEKHPDARDGALSLGIAWQRDITGAKQVLEKFESMPEVHAPLAYLFGLRSSRVNNLEIARYCFQTAVASEAASKQIRDLAAEELKRLSEDKSKQSQ